MTRKQVSEEITSYISSLLSEDLEALTDAPVDASNEKFDDRELKSEPSEEPKADGVNSETKDKPTPRVVAEVAEKLNVPEATVKSQADFTKPFTDFRLPKHSERDKAAEPPSPALSSSSKEANVEKNGVEKASTDTSTEEATGPIQVPLVKPLEDTQAKGTENQDADAYEQHKQRLEKMLQQVSAIEMNSGGAETVKIDSSLEKPSEELLADQGMEALYAINPAAVYQDIPPLSSEWLDNGRPNWAQELFDILLIEVNGLQLAVPLAALGHIQRLEENLTPLFGQPDWLMGLHKTPTGHFKTVNTAKFVMPERYQAEHDYQFVVSINGLAWGLAVDSIRQPISVSPDGIRWRQRRARRPWMAGTLKDHMCVLLDIPSLGEILQEQDKNAIDKNPQ